MKIFNQHHLNRGKYKFYSQVNQWIKFDLNSSLMKNNDGDLVMVRYGTSITGKLYCISKLSPIEIKSISKLELEII